MHEIDVWVSQHILISGVALGDTELVADLVELLLGALADRVHVRLGMLLVDRNKLRSKTQPDDGDVHFVFGHDDVSPRTVLMAFGEMIRRWTMICKCIFAAQKR